MERYWKENYSEIDLASSKISVLEKNNFTIRGYFPLSPECWLTNYYEPLEAGIDSFLMKHNHAKEAQDVVNEHKGEISLYRKYQDYFSYGFYIAQKNPGKIL